MLLEKCMDYDVLGSFIQGYDWKTKVVNGEFFGSDDRCVE